MKHDDDWDDRYWIRIAIRVLIFIIVFSVVFGVISRIFNPMGQSMFLFPNWAWDLIGLFFLLWFISWIVREPWFHYRHEERILRRRYARGEISRAQFKRMMKDLKESRS